ncbi:hypothetical protein NIES2107_30610 [Nostoc carneum NIES-2107]|nr:hypothetical protein NIES2107_30610 [Nostoc carneum NIES-2107]
MHLSSQSIIAVFETTIAIFNTTIAAFETTIAIFDTTIAAFETTIAIFDTTIAAFETTIAIFDTTIAAFETTIAIFDTTIAAFETTIANCVYLETIDRQRQTSKNTDILPIMRVIKSTKLLISVIKTLHYLEREGIEEYFP